MNLGLGIENNENGMRGEIYKVREYQSLCQKENPLVSRKGCT